MKYLAALCVTSLLLTGCTKDKPHDPAPAAASSSSADVAAAATGAPRHLEVADQKSITATVEAIDPETRMVTLRGPQGNTLTFRAGEAVKNLSQVKVGDKVNAFYYESLALDLRAPGAAPVNETVAGATAAQPGERPAAKVAQQTTITATVEAVDRANSTVTLKGPQGNTRTLRVRDPQRLERVKVGDQLVATYTEAMAVSVEPAK